MKWFKKILTIFISLSFLILGYFLITSEFEHKGVSKWFNATFNRNERLEELKKQFEQDSKWNIEKNEDIKELNFARYSAYKHKLEIYLENSNMPKKSIQLSSLKKIDTEGKIVDGNNKVVGLTKNLFPLRYNSKIYSFSKKYANSGAVDTKNLIHSPNNPNFSQNKNKNKLPNFDIWNLSDYEKITFESIAHGYFEVSDTIKGWINEDDNVEQNPEEVLGHRIHVLDTTKNYKYGAIAKSNKEGWVFNSGIVYNHNWKVINSCNFISLDRENFTYKKEFEDYISTYYPTQHQVVKFNPNICEGIKIKAVYPDKINDSLEPNTPIKNNEKYLIFQQEALPGYVLKDSNSNNVEIEIMK